MKEKKSDSIESVTDDKFNPDEIEARKRSGKSAGDYARNAGEALHDKPKTRERSGNRPGDYAQYIDQTTVDEPKTRERSGNRPGDYARFFGEDPNAKPGIDRANSGAHATHYEPEADPKAKKVVQEVVDKFKDTLSQNNQEAPSDSLKPKT
jgi:hypothetical protein